MTPTLRLAFENEAELLTAIHKEGFPNYWNIEAFNNFFAIIGTRALIAEFDRPVGMMVLRVVGDEADIITVSVLPEARRLGIGRLLVQEAIRQAKAEGAHSMFLDVEEGNDAALKLYESFGFSPINRRKHYYRQKDGSYTDALVMKRNLA